MKLNQLFIIHSPADKDYTVHRMLMGTHTSDNDNNYVQICTVHLPKPQSQLDLEKYDDTRGGKLNEYWSNDQRVIVKLIQSQLRRLNFRNWSSRCY